MGGSTEGAATKGGGVEGVVLEIGAGVGANFVYYDRDRVTALVANEPNAGMHQTLRRAAAEAGWVCDDDDDNGDNDDNGAPHDASHEGGGGGEGRGAQCGTDWVFDRHGVLTQPRVPRRHL